MEKFFIQKNYLHNIYMNIIKPSPLELIEIANSLKFRSIRLSDWIK